MSLQPSPIKRHDQMSQATVALIKKVTQQLADQALQHLAAPTVPALKDKAIPFESAQQHFKVASQGFDLYTVADLVEGSIPTIWVKKDILNPATGKYEPWLVAYTTDDNDIESDIVTSSAWDGVSNPLSGGGFMPHARVFDRVRSLHGTVLEVMGNQAKIQFDETGDVETLPMENLEVMSAQKENLVATAAEGGGSKTKPAPMIAPGMTSKNLTLDQGGTSGNSAKVTVEFNDIEKGLSFFQQVEDLASDVGGGQTPAAPGKVPEEGEESKTPAPAEGGEPGGGPAAPAPLPAAAPSPAPMPQASTIKNLTSYGQKVVVINAEKTQNYPTKYAFVNEDGYRVELDWESPLKVGSKFLRPDNGEVIRVQGYAAIQVVSDDESIINKIADDISDRVQPMDWTNSQSQNPDQGQQGNPMPQNPALQSDSPTADTSQPPVYDSTQGGETKQKFNMSVNPNDNSVTVKFQEPDQLQTIQDMVKGQQPKLDVPPVPPAVPGAPAQGQQPLTGQPKQELNEVAPPVQY